MIYYVFGRALQSIKKCVGGFGIMIITEIHFNSAGNPVRYQVEAGHNTADYKVTVAKPQPTCDHEGKYFSGRDFMLCEDPIRWIECESWTYEDILRIQSLLLIVVDRIKEFYDDHKRLVANAEWMEE
jgi:hypothetical protein